MSWICYHCGKRIDDINDHAWICIAGDERIHPFHKSCVDAITGTKYFVAPAADGK